MYRLIHSLELEGILLSLLVRALRQADRNDSRLGRLGEGHLRDPDCLEIGRSHSGGVDCLAAIGLVEYKHAQRGIAFAGQPRVELVFQPVQVEHIGGGIIELRLGEILRTLVLVSPELLSVLGAAALERGEVVAWLREAAAAEAGEAVGTAGGEWFEPSTSGSTIGFRCCRLFDYRRRRQ